MRALRRSPGEHQIAFPAREWLPHLIFVCDLEFDVDARRCPTETPEQFGEQLFRCGRDGRKANATHIGRAATRASASASSSSANIREPYTAKLAPPATGAPTRVRQESSIGS